MLEIISKIIDNTRCSMPSSGAILPIIINKPSTNTGEENNYMGLTVQGPGDGKTYFVDCNIGNDLNDGLTKETAFKTIQKQLT